MNFNQNRNNNQNKNEQNSQNKNQNNNQNKNQQNSQNKIESHQDLICPVSDRVLIKSWWLFFFIGINSRILRR